MVFLEPEREFFVSFLFNKNKFQLSFPSNSILKLNLLIGLFEGNNILKTIESIQDNVFSFHKISRLPNANSLCFIGLIFYWLHHFFTQENTKEVKENFSA